MEHHPIRLLWTYDHPTARFQEVTLFLEAGFEVIVSHGNPNSLKYDADYHNETSAIYPKWRKSCTLPSDISEEVRKACLIDSSIEISEENKMLINNHIHAILLTTEDPWVVQKLIGWFKGIILYRINGFVNVEAQYKFWNALLTLARHNRKWEENFYYCAGQFTLMPHDISLLYRNYLILNVWVDTTRVEKKWAAEQSATKISTAISYIDHHPFFQEQYQNFIKHINALPFNIIGKNDKSSVLCKDQNITGPMNRDDFYLTIANSRIFIDAGTCATHIVFPPIEAMHMGVPVLYHIESGIAATALSEGYSKEELYQAGMFNSFAEINEFVLNQYHDIRQLKSIAEKQNAIFINKIFNRNRALAEVIQLRSKLIERNQQRYSISISIFEKLAQTIKNLKRNHV